MHVKMKLLLLMRSIPLDLWRISFLPLVAIFDWLALFPGDHLLGDG